MSYEILFFLWFNLAYTNTMKLISLKTIYLALVFLFFEVFFHEYNLSGISQIHPFLAVIEWGILWICVKDLFQIQKKEYAMGLTLSAGLSLLLSFIRFPQFHLFLAILSAFIYLYPFLEGFYQNLRASRVTMFFLFMAFLFVIKDMHISGISEYCFLFGIHYFYQDQIEKDYF